MVGALTDFIQFLVGPLRERCHICYVSLWFCIDSNLLFQLDIIRLFESGEEEQICFIVKCDPSCSINNDALLEAIQKNKSDFKLNTKDRKLKTGVSRTTLQYWAHPSHFSLWSTVGDSGNCWLIEFRKSKRLFYHPFQLIRDGTSLIPCGY